MLEQDLGTLYGQPRKDPSYSGSVTLRIEITGPETASYDFSYSEEAIGDRAGTPCFGQIESATTGSLKTTAAITVLPRGSVFRVAPKVTLPVTTKRGNCPGNINPGETTTRNIKLDYFEFSPGKGSASLRGSGRLFCCDRYSPFVFPKPGETGVTWNLARVTASGSTTNTSASGPLKVSKLAAGSISKYIASGFFAVTRGGDPTGVKSASCTGSFKGGPRLISKPATTMASGTVNAKTVLYWPELRPLSGKPVTVVVCTFEHDEYTKACGKTFHVSVRVVADGTKPLTRSSSFVWKAPPVKRSC